MPSVEDRLKAYADRAIESTAPVTADEVRARPSRRTGPVVWIAMAAVLLLILGIAVTVNRGDDDTKVATGGTAYPLTLDGHLDWQLAVLNGDVEPTDEELASRYSPEFIRAIPPEQFRATRAQVRPKAPWRVLAEVERRGEEVLAVQLASADGTQVRLTMMKGEDGRLTASTILLAQPCAPVVPVEGTVVPTAIDVQWHWVLDLLTSDRLPSQVSREEVDAHLTSANLARLTVMDFLLQLGRVRELGPFTVRAFEGQPNAVLLRARLGVRTGEEARLELAVELPAPHRIVGISVLTQPPCEVTPAS